MKIYFHEKFLEQYAFDPAAEPGRLDATLSLLKKRYAIHQPRPASQKEILQVHTARHWDSIANDQLLLNTALLAAGSTLESAESALKGDPAFALCRPPGHHASTDSCWGFCYFNNIAVAVRHLLNSGSVNSALVIDFDLHFGDGTANIFDSEKAVTFWHSSESNSSRYLSILENDLRAFNADVTAISAGFDRGVNDWGGMLSREDYKNIGIMLGSFAREKCEKRLFAALEGGYNSTALSKNIASFLDGLNTGLIL